MKGPVFEIWSSDNDELEDREPFRTRIHRKGVGIIEMISFDDRVDMYCPMCRKAGFSVKLGPKIIMPGETRQPDYEQWLQCPSCAEVIAAFIVEHDATIIRDDIETISNPFENTTEIMGAVSKRHTKAGRRAMDKRNKERYKATHKDPEIQRELDQHGSDNVHIIQ